MNKNEFLKEEGNQRIGMKNRIKIRRKREKIGKKRKKIGKRRKKIGKRRNRKKDGKTDGKG